MVATCVASQLLAAAVAVGANYANSVLIMLLPWVQLHHLTVSVVVAAAAVGDAAAITSVMAVLWGNSVAADAFAVAAVTDAILSHRLPKLWAATMS